ncbi:hypothetical protein C8Q74DRAFT_1373010 [Fomes fomentarius]|nr:hypothetical protein C8Q74DRAFT_1373010 [Fomes fomentarius]
MPVPVCVLKSLQDGTENLRVRAAQGRTPPADAAENKIREVLALFKSANESKVAAEQASARANEELRLYKMQYENARAELRRAQKLIDALEAQRIDAEEAAAKARSMARKLKEEKIIMRAREEGRSVGYEHGRSVASEHAYTSAPVTEMGYETPRARRYEPPPEDKPLPEFTRSSTSEDSEENMPGPNYTQPMDDNLAMPAPVSTPARIPTPASPPQASRSNTDIPKIDDDMRIRLPPSHEMAWPPPTSPSPPLSAVLNNVRNIPDEPVMIPPQSILNQSLAAERGTDGAIPLNRS